MKTVRVFIERGKDGSYGAYMPDENNLSYGVIGDGDTAAAAIADFKAVYEDIKASYHKEGHPFEEVDFIFSYDLPSFLRYYAGKLTFAGLAKLTGVSAAQLSQYANGYRNPSPKTTQKIQNALNAFGNELSQLQLV
ncbi:MAG: helix-turn-helix domain-containing protein [Muribaculaceae bacterium]|nr:helix-turn-helix domain-containing protein [Muribaculaceae bacterium]